MILAIVWCFKVAKEVIERGYDGSDVTKVQGL